MTSDNYYEALGWSQYTEEDTYENGCDPDSGWMTAGNERFVGDSLEELIDKLKSFCGTDDDEAVELDSCDEPGRVDICLMVDEVGDGYISERELERWKRGEMDLYYRVYSFYVRYIESSVIHLNP